MEEKFFMDAEKKFLTIYFAGDLFDAKDLGGNLMLARAIEEFSKGAYQIRLPQDGECEVTERTAKNIRDEDFRMLLESDLIIANFDGCDPDSGTVTEFCFAKMMDIPALLLRTDFRDGGDAALPDSTPWNLMLSHFPRTEILHLNSMQIYHDCRESGDFFAGLTAFYRDIAGKVVAALDRVRMEKSWLKKANLSVVLENTVKSIGGADGNIFSAGELNRLIRKKENSGLYQ